jgi:hypothetical protein
MTVKVTPGLIEEYFRLFVNRRAYTMQSLLPHRASGRHYYYRPRDGGHATALSGGTIP